MEETIANHLKKFDLDLRITHNGRFMDQKVTPDVLSFIADCILNYIGSNPKKEFTVKSIWESDYFEKNVPSIFGKPSPSNTSTSSEYDKFIAQPLKTLAYSGILHEEKRGLVNNYTVNDYELLEFISIRERNALTFLSIYLRKVLTDSGFIKSIDEYITRAADGKFTKEDFQELKFRYQSFIRGNTPINGNTEINRIFPKVINIFAVKNGIQGTESGLLTAYNFNFSELMYNRQNFRDINKPKGLSRREASASIEEYLNLGKKAYSDYRIQKVMAIIRKKYPMSELNDKFSDGIATEVHHIFPQHSFPQLAAYIENLIKLTSTQHNSYAHPKGNKRLIDKDYQLTCLLAKSDSIERSLNTNELIYSKESFIYVINTGLTWDLNSSLNIRQVKETLANDFFA